MTTRKVLHLVLKRKWYDMIASGEKTEEYREVKPYWFKRFVDYDSECYVDNNPIPTYFRQTAPFASPAKAILWDLDMAGVLDFKQFTHVTFQLGYQKDALRMTFEIGNISIGKGNPQWGAPENKEVFIIKFGNKIADTFKGVER